MSIPEFTKSYHHKSYPAISPIRLELSQAGKTVFITGAGRGLGTGIVDAFAQAGAQYIVVMGRNATSLQDVAARTEKTYPSTKVTIVTGDVSNEADLARAFAEIKKVAPKGLDVLVANAGYLQDVGPIPAIGSSEQSKPDDVLVDWWTAFEVNTKAIFQLARHFLTVATPSAVFLNVSAASAHVQPVLPGFSAYSSSKIATARLIENLQAEHSNSGLRFFNLHPGIVQTDMFTKSGFGAADMPLDDLELPGHFLLWLTSPEAEFLKGRFLWSNWDVEELKARKEEILSENKLVLGLSGWA